MRSKGNGTPAVCADNLLKLVRGDVPFSRIKGLDPSFIDRPFGEIATDIQQDAEWLLKTYEPRTEVNNINIKPSDAMSGGFIVSADIKEQEV